MKRAEFVHLHNHSEYSLSDGLIRLTAEGGGPSELLRGLAKNGAKGIALTDHGNRYGAFEFHSQCTAAGLNPIIGLEAYLSRGKRKDRGRSQEENYHLTLLARDFTGYQSLMQLSSKAFLEGCDDDPCIDRERLTHHRKGLLVLSGCLKSEMAQTALRGDMEECVELATSCRDLLEPGCYFLEIMDHGLPQEKDVIRVLLEVSRKTGIPLVATNDCHFVKKADAEAQAMRICIATGEQFDNDVRLRPESREYYFKSPEEMTKIFSSVPEACANTLKIAEMCRLRIPMDQLVLPEFRVPKGHSEDSFLRELCVQGLRDRFRGEIPVGHQERLTYELSVIKSRGCSGYFLIVWDFIRYARQQRIPVGPGRGAGAGSLVTYALGITGLDPIAHGLLFERFLNPDRKSMPDLDIDFSEEGREKVIEYVRRKYGEMNVARIGTFSVMAARTAIRDVGRALGTPLPVADMLAKTIPLGQTIGHNVIENCPELKGAAQSPEIDRILKLAQKLEGLRRNPGVHAAGIVIARDPVGTYAPLARHAGDDVIMTQYDGDALSKLGLLKIDFLGLRLLSVLDEAGKAIREYGNPRFDIDRISMDDAKTFELLCSGETLGVFQLDSDGIRDLLRKIEPTVFSDIVALIALYRPGPMKAGIVDMFVSRKHSHEKVEYDHTLLEPILSDTYGCIIFQEQVMEISKKLANFTPGEADGLRKALGKRARELLVEMRGKFVEGCAANAINSGVARKVFDQMVEFGPYCFNKSHSSAYGLLAYQSAYLKANYPTEFSRASRKYMRYP